MTAAMIPGDVRRFLLATIPTVPHLEALLLLRGRREEWPLALLASRLYVDAPNAKALLDDLSEAALVTASAADGYRYAPADADVAATVDSLAALYARQTVAVAELIHSSSDRKAQRFADAFRLRKET
jgi:hypothetical protein